MLAPLIAAVIALGLLLVPVIHSAAIGASDIPLFAPGQYTQQELTTSTLNDGIPDVWKVYYGLSISDPAVANADYNSSGIMNLEKYRLNIHPIAPAAPPETATPPKNVAKSVTSTAKNAPSSSPPSVANGNFTGGVNIGNSTTSGGFTNASFHWSYNTKVEGWNALVGNQIEVWRDASGSQFVELNASGTSRGIEQKIASAKEGTSKAGTYVLSWRDLCRNQNQADDGAYKVHVFAKPAGSDGSMGGVSVATSPKPETCVYKPLKQASYKQVKDWPQQFLVFTLTEEMLKNNPDVWIAFEPKSSATYGAFIAEVRLSPIELTWEAKGDWNNVDDNPDPFSDSHKIVGKRIFPDSLEPSGVMRRELKLNVRIAGLAKIRVYLKVFDVDDPTPLPDPYHKLDTNDTDSKKAGNDNIRGAGLIEDWGYFLPQRAKKVAVDLDSSGEANVEFKVNQQPGNNYRVAAAIKESDLDFLQVSDNDAQGYVPPDDLQVSGFNGGTSPMLTVWRRLNVEVDTMEPLQGPKGSPDHVAATGDHWGKDILGRDVLYLSDNLPEGDNFYQGGRIKSVSAELAIAFNDKNSITLTSNGKKHEPTQLKSFKGPIEVFDDDDKGIQNLLPHPQAISQGIKEKYSKAYIDIVQMPDSKNPHKTIPFELYTTPMGPFWSTSLNDAKDHHGDDRVGYWCHYVCIAYKPGRVWLKLYSFPEADGDPNTEKRLVGISDPPTPRYNPVGYSAVFTETLRDDVADSPVPIKNINEEFSKEFDNVVAHEIGHYPGRRGGHYETGLMDDGAPTPDFSPESLYRFRKTSFWGDEW